MGLWEGTGQKSRSGSLRFGAELLKTELWLGINPGGFFMETSFDQKINQQTKQPYPFRHPSICPLDHIASLTECLLKIF